MTVPGWYRLLPLPLWLKYVLGSCLAMAGRLFVLVVIASSAFGVFVGEFSAIDSTLHARDRWYAEGHVADLELRFAPVPATSLPDLGQVAGVADFRTRLVSQGTVGIPAGTGSGRSSQLSLLLITSATRPAAPLNTVVLEKGALLQPGDASGVLVDRNLAGSKHLGIGDTVTVDIGERAVPLTVRGVVRSAEYLLAPVNPSLFIPSKGSLGIAFADPAATGRAGAAVLANSVLMRAAAGTDVERLRTQVLAVASAAGLRQTYALTRTEQFSYLYLQKDLGVFRTIIPVMVLVCALSALFVTMFLLAQWISRERRRVGVLMTLGYSGRTLATGFGVVCVLLAGWAMVGGLISAEFVGRAFITGFAHSIGLPDAPLELTGPDVAVGCAGLLVLFAVAGLVTIRSVLTVTPLDGMRDTTTGEMPPGRVGSWLGRRLPTSWLRVAARNTLRSRTVSALTTVSIALGFGVTSAFFIALSSVVDSSVGAVERNTWDLSVDVRAPMAWDRLSALVAGPGVTESAPYVKGVARASANGHGSTVYVGGFDPARAWYPVTMVAGHDLRADQPHGVLLEQSTARELELGVGDRFAVSSVGGSYPVEVIGVFAGALPGETRVPLALGQQLSGLGNTVTGGFVRVGHDDSDAVQRRVAGLEGVQQVLTKDQIKTEIVRASGQVTQILRLGSAVSIGVALLFVVACLGYTVLRRRDSYQVLRVLGFRDGVIRLTIMAETCLLGLAAIVLATPIGAVTAAYMARKLSDSWFHVDTAVGVADYARTFLPGFLLLPLVALPMARGVLRHPLDQFLRSRDIG